MEGCDPPPPLVLLGLACGLVGLALLGFDKIRAWTLTEHAAGRTSRNNRRSRGLLLVGFQRRNAHRVLLGIFLVGYAGVWGSIHHAADGLAPRIQRYQRECRSSHRIGWVSAASLFYLQHVRSCAAATVGSRQSPMSSHLRMGGCLAYLGGCWGRCLSCLDSLYRRFGHFIIYYWILRWGRGREYGFLGIAIVLRIIDCHLPLRWCRILTFVLVGGGLWKSTGVVGRLLWACLLWAYPWFPGHGHEGSISWKRPLGESCAMEVDEDVSMGRDILFPRDSLTLVDAQLAILFGEDVTAAELLREQ